MTDWARLLRTVPLIRVFQSYSHHDDYSPDYDAMARAVEREVVSILSHRLYREDSRGVALVECENCQPLRAQLAASEEARGGLIRRHRALEAFTAHASDCDEGCDCCEPLTEDACLIGYPLWKELQNANAHCDLLGASMAARPEGAG